MKLAVVLLSGGLDSCVTAALAMEAGYDIALLHINYGQRTQGKELAAFTAIADYYGIKKRLVVDISYFRDIGGSSLTDYSINIEEGEGGREQLFPSTYVPFRNGNMVSIAVSWAEVIGAERVYIGVVEGDGGYPDCTESFYEKFNALLSVGLPAGKTVFIETPLINLKKSEIVCLGSRLGVPFELTWSCYQSESVACGVCSSCKLRLKAFCDIGEKDPICYRGDDL